MCISFGLCCLLPFASTLVISRFGFNLITSESHWFTVAYAPCCVRVVFKTCMCLICILHGAPNPPKSRKCSVSFARCTLRVRNSRECWDS